MVKQFHVKLNVLCFSYKLALKLWVLYSVEYLLSRPYIRTQVDLMVWAELTKANLFCQGLNISEMTRLVSYSRSATVKIYQQWSEEQKKHQRLPVRQAFLEKETNPFGSTNMFPKLISFTPLLCHFCVLLLINRLHDWCWLKGYSFCLQ